MAHKKIGCANIEQEFLSIIYVQVILGTVCTRPWLEDSEKALENRYYGVPAPIAIR